MSLATYIIICIIAGIGCGWLMHGLMLAMSKRHEIPVDMVKALGSWGTGDTGKRARSVGFFLHTVGGAVLGLIYGLLFYWIGIHDHPLALLLGFILGFFHGQGVALALMYYVAERHPVPEYRRSSIQVGMVHLGGHLFFGVALSLVIFLCSLLPWV